MGGGDPDLRLWPSRARLYSGSGIKRVQRGRAFSPGNEPPSYHRAYSLFCLARPRLAGEIPRNPGGSANTGPESNSGNFAVSCVQTMSPRNIPHVTRRARAPPPSRPPRRGERPHRASPSGISTRPRTGEMSAKTGPKTRDSNVLQPPPSRPFPFLRIPPNDLNFLAPGKLPQSTPGGLPRNFAVSRFWTTFQLWGSLPSSEDSSRERVRLGVNTPILAWETEATKEIRWRLHGGSVPSRSKRR